MEGFVGIILAAGEGFRMKSRIPKVLHCLGGKELLRYPVELLGKVGIERIIVVVSPANQEAVKNLLGDSVEYAVQSSKTGTAGAVESAASLVDHQAMQVVVMGGDSPLIAKDSLKNLIEGHIGNSRQMSILSGLVQDNLGLGRINREQGG